MSDHDKDLVTPEELAEWRTHDWQPQAFHRLIATLDFFAAENNRLREDIKGEEYIAGIERARADEADRLRKALVAASFRLRDAGMELAADQADAALEGSSDE